MTKATPAHIRIWRFVDPITDPNGCWLWTGAKTKGYGTFRGGTTNVAHRVMYGLLVGPVPDGLVLDHLCRNRSCVNPRHLEPVTDRANLLRGSTTWAARNAAKTHCIHGHEFTTENTRQQGGKRFCRACGRDKQRRYIERHQEAI